MSDTKSSPAGPASPVVADLGARSRKAIKKMRRGEGPLLEDIEKLVAQLTADRAVARGAQPVVVIVKERRRSGMFF